MDTVKADGSNGAIEFEVRGVQVRLLSTEHLPEGTSPQSYALSRMPITNGGVDRIGHRGLTVELDPDGKDAHDTFISPGVEVGSGVIVGAHTHIKSSVVVGPNAVIGRGCEIGEHAHVGSDVEIGDNNHIPSFATVANGVEIPDGLFRFGSKGPSTRDMMAEITQEFVDTKMAAIGSFARN